MLNNITIGRYINKSSVVHKLNPVFKIISLIIMIISIFFIDSYIDITLLSMYLLLTMLYSDIDIKVYLKNIYGIKIFLIFIFIIDLIFFTSINRIIFDIFKLIFIVLYSSILTYTTSITELTFGIEKLLRPFNKLIPVGDIAMIITLSIRYIPTLTEEASRIIKAQKLRGINFDTKNIIIIFLGAFSGLDIIRDKRLNSNPLGFSIKEETHKSKAKFLKQDLVKYGLPEEFVGRIDTIVEMNELTKKDLALILKKSELSIFNMGITLIYNDDLFESIAEKSLVLDTGARELSNTVNYMFENIVFDVLSNPNKYKKCILDSEIAQDNTKYTLS